MLKDGQKLSAPWERQCVCSVLPSPLNPPRVPRGSVIGMVLLCDVCSPNPPPIIPGTINYDTITASYLRMGGGKVPPWRCVYPGMFLLVFFPCGAAMDLRQTQRPVDLGPVSVLTICVTMLFDSLSPDRRLSASHWGCGLLGFRALCTSGGVHHDRFRPTV